MQLIANTGSVTSTAGFEWINRPINPDNIVRYFCNAEINIDGCDRTKYPAICFNLVTKTAPTQYWVYPDTASRDADCDMLSDAVGPPPSDYLAYWDITGDGLPDTGTGKGPIAVYIGGVSGTHEADQLYFDEVGIPTAMPVPFDSIIEMRTSGSPYVLANYDGANGSSLGDVTKWTGPYAFDVAVNMLGTVGHTNLMQFSKLPFAVAVNLTYTRALAYLLKIKARKNGLLSGNIGNILQMPIETSVGQIAFPNDIDVRDHLGKTGLFVHVSLFSGEGTPDQGVVDIQDTTERWSKNRIITDAGATFGGTHARYFADSKSPIGVSVVWSINLDEPFPRAESFRSVILSIDPDGFPKYGLAQNINAVGDAGASNTSPGGMCVVEALFSGGMPLMFVTKGGSTKTGSICANIGDTTNPNYGSFLATAAIQTDLKGLTLARADGTGRIHTPRGGAASVGEFSRLTYSGLNNDAAQLIIAGNWSHEFIGNTAAVSPAANGDGLTFQGHCFGVAINEDDIVNSEPTIYVTDNVNHVLWEVTRNALSLGTAADWDWTVVVGQTGVAGNTDGTGTAATLNVPRGVAYNNGFLYLSNRNSHTVRKIRTSDYLTETYFGIAGSPGTNMQFDF